jgi:hypothetical protein
MIVTGKIANPRRDRYESRGRVGICECSLGANRVWALRQLRKS